MLRFIVTADLHFDLFDSQASVDHEGLTLRARDIERAVSKIHKYAIDNHIKDVFVAGDIFHKRDQISVPLFNLAYDTLGLFKRDGINLWMIPGNHDQTTKGGMTDSISSMRDIATICSAPFRVRVGGYNFYMLPYSERGKIVKDLDTLLEETPPSAIPNFLIAHVGLKGSKYSGFEILSKDPTHFEELHPEKFAGMFFGHFHHPQKIAENAHYCGAPIQHDFKDVDSERGFLDCTMDKELQVNFVPLTGFPQFHNVDADKYKTGMFPERDSVRLVGATRKQQASFATDPQVCGTKDSKPDKSSVRLELGLSETWDSAIEKYVGFQQKEDKLTASPKEYIQFGSDIMKTIGAGSWQTASRQQYQFKVKARNFMAFGNEWASVDFSALGLSLVRGKNLASSSKTSNGSGKSTLLTALIYGLYGLTKKVLKKNIPNRSTKKNCEVVVDIIDPQGRHAVITKCIRCEGRDDGIYFEIDGKDHRKGRDSDTQEAIVEFVGLSKEAFLTSVFFGAEEESSNFAAKTSGPQTDLFTQLLKLNDLVRALDEVKDLRDINKEASAALTQRCLTLAAQIKMLKEEIAAAVELSVEWKQEQDVKISETKHYIKTTNEKLRLTLEQLDDLEDAIDEKKGALKALTEEFETLDLASASDALAFLHNTRLAHEKAIGGEENVLASLMQRQASFRKLHKTPACPTCLKPLSEEYRLSTLTETVAATKAQEALLEDLKKEVLQNLASQRELLVELDAAKMLQHKIVMGKNDLKTMQTRLDSLGEVEVSYRTALKRYEDTKEELQFEAPPQKKSIRGLEYRKDQLLKEIEDAELEQEDVLDSQRELINFWLEGFGGTGLRNFLVEGVLPELNELAAKYSEILTNGELRVTFKAQKSTQAKEIRNSLNIEIEDMFGSENYYTASGGEKRRINIIVNLALHGLVAKRNNIGFCVMDEAFVRMDGAGEQHTLDLLLYMLDSIPSIFVISNKESIKAEFYDNILTVLREGLTSRMEKDNE